MRITPDTGILVRMNVRATGPARRLFELILGGPHELILSEFLLEETARVLSYLRMPTLYKIDCPRHRRTCGGYCEEAPAWSRRSCTNLSCWRIPMMTRSFTPPWRAGLTCFAL